MVVDGVGLCSRRVFSHGQHFCSEDVQVSEASMAHRILLAAILAVFYILEALAVRNVASDTVKAAYIIWPREGWAMGMGAALLWLIVSFFCCCERLYFPLLRMWPCEG